MTAPFSSSKTDLLKKPPTRRTILTGLAGASLLGFKNAKAANPSGSITPSSVVSQPARAWGAQASPSFLPDPDVLFLDPSFKDLTYFAAPIRRVWDQGGWLEGPAWSTEGRFLVLSDVIRSRALRYTWETGEISDFRPDSYAANGNCFDFTGRLIVCEDFFRRVVRWEHDGSVKILADRYNEQGLNSPNDIVPHPDGSVWFTDPGYGTNLAEGHPDAPGGPTNPDGKIRWNIGRELIGEIGGTKRQADHVFRIAPDGTLTAVLQEKDIRDPNGLCFSPDYKKLYVVSTPKGPGQSVGGDQAIHVYDVKDGTLSNGRIFSTMQLNGIQMNPDGIRVDVFGNLWCGASGPLGLCGVMVFNPAGKLIGRIRLPQGCSNLTFGGPKRDHLFMCAAGSLFTLQVGVQGFAPS
ncbi:SMP-30/gluconolactonase/LRE family protein [Gluconobacter kanchanaburiensis]|uniref:Gluconolactonase n=1 Tax=Gluconobacter kanchanaburiensis NBRC 103587 TaxID=1307948 RepID=A0A511BBP6_9PROT|nr:SMP-30/gluconolactonase/LRE family protein [Gluconobacter kanchanaburiensis]MBF0862766.1 SMP-30/gluconolactonase/LRE family protein [Gluconobacter kanchanaburiensis]GBR69161.1 gluconolactonase [Gluconobacter kanchanaburiensis NBRC 103587]GEK97043.1 gluconolactonase [Gluconobacter kanchanaburiensis NBRC 103587]